MPGLCPIQLRILLSKDLSAAPTTSQPELGLKMQLLHLLKNPGAVCPVDGKAGVHTWGTGHGLPGAVLQLFRLRVRGAPARFHWPNVRRDGALRAIQRNTRGA